MILNHLMSVFCAGMIWTVQGNPLGPVTACFGSWLDVLPNATLFTPCIVCFYHVTSISKVDLHFARIIKLEGWVAIFWKVLWGEKGR